MRLPVLVRHFSNRTLRATPGLESASLPVQIAFAIQPRRVEPLQLPAKLLFQLLQLFVVLVYVRQPIVDEGSQLAIMLQLVLQFRELSNNLLAFLLRRGIGKLSCRAMHIVNALSLCSYQMSGLGRILVELSGAGLPI